MHGTAIPTDDAIEREPALTPGRWHSHPRLLHEYWLSKRMAGRLPARSAIDPASLKPLLPYLIVFAVEAAPLRFRYRLVGSEITSWAGRELTGLWLHEVPGGAGLADFLAPAALERRAVWRRGRKLLGVGGGYGFVETVALPLAADGETPDQILCLSVGYHGDGAAIVRERPN